MEASKAFITVAFTLLASVARSRALSLQSVAATGHDGATSPSSPGSVIEEYLNLHGPDAFRREFEANKSAICERKFFSQQCTAPPRFGNEMGLFINGFALAVVTNRTLLLAEDNCSTYLNFSGRILRKGEAKEMLAQAGCKLGWYSAQYQSGRELNGAFDRDARFHVSSRYWHRESAAKSFGNKNLSPEAARRARALFGSGSIFGYNALFRAAWEIKASVRDPVDKLLMPYAGFFKVGLHVRHAIGCLGSCPQFDDQAVQCVKSILKNSTSHKCAVLIATDSEEAQEALPKKLQQRILEGSVAAEMLRFSKQIEAATGCKAQTTLATERVVQKDNAWEHGLWNRDTAMMDLYMLSRSDALVVGESHSTFAERASELFADLEVKQHAIRDWGSQCSLVSF